MMWFLCFLYRRRREGRGVEMMSLSLARSFTNSAILGLRGRASMKGCLLF